MRSINIMHGQPALASDGQEPRPARDFHRLVVLPVGNATAWRRWRTRVLPLARCVAPDLAHTCAVGARVCRAGMTLGARRV
jgi:hypothetical protein